MSKNTNDLNHSALNENPFADNTDLDLDDDDFLSAPGYSTIDRDANLASQSTPLTFTDPTSTTETPIVNSTKGQTGFLSTYYFSYSTFSIKDLYKSLIPTLGTGSASTTSTSTTFSSTNILTPTTSIFYPHWIVFAISLLTYISTTTLYQAIEGKHNNNSKDSTASPTVMHFLGVYLTLMCYTVFYAGFHCFRINKLVRKLHNWLDISSMITMMQNLTVSLLSVSVFIVLQFVVEMILVIAIPSNQWTTFKRVNGLCKWGFACIDYLIRSRYLSVNGRITESSTRSPGLEAGTAADTYGSTEQEKSQLSWTEVFGIQLLSLFIVRFVIL